MDTRRLKRFLCLLLLMQFTSWAYADEADMLLGGWLTAEGKSKVEVYKCGEKYCGKIVWLKAPQYPAGDPQGMAGKDKIDRENPDPALKNRPLIGILMIQDFIYDGEAEWSEGTIYDPRNGKTYNCKMTLTDENTLEVRGYVGLPLFGKTAIWTRTKLDDVVRPAAVMTPESNAAPGGDVPSSAPLGEKSSVGEEPAATSAPVTAPAVEDSAVGSEGGK